MLGTQLLICLSSHMEKQTSHSIIKNATIIYYAGINHLCTSRMPKYSHNFISGGDSYVNPWHVLIAEN